MTPAATGRARAALAAGAPFRAENAAQLRGAGPRAWEGACPPGCPMGLHARARPAPPDQQQYACLARRTAFPPASSRRHPRLIPAPSTPLAWVPHPPQPGPEPQPHLLPQTKAVPRDRPAAQAPARGPPARAPGPPTPPAPRGAHHAAAAPARAPQRRPAGPAQRRRREAGRWRGCVLHLGRPVPCPTCLSVLSVLDSSSPQNPDPPNRPVLDSWNRAPKSPPLPFAARRAAVRSESHTAFPVPLAALRHLRARRPRRLAARAAGHITALELHLAARQREHHGRRVRMAAQSAPPGALRRPPCIHRAL